MNATLEAIRESNRLLVEQNVLLMRLAEAPPLSAANQDEFSDCDMMTDHDLQMIMNSPNIYTAIDRWNKRCDERAKRRLKR
jgi:hypothetical protein